MLRIEIKDSAVHTRSIPYQGGSFEVREQTGWIDFPSGERRRFNVSLPKTQMEGYKPGFYTLGLSSFGVNQFGGLEISRAMELVVFLSLRRARRALRFEELTAMCTPHGGYDPYNSADTDPRVREHRARRGEIFSFVMPMLRRWLAAGVTWRG